MDNNHYYQMNSMGSGYYPNGQPTIQPDGLLPDGYAPRLYQVQTGSQENLNNYSDIEDHARSSISQQGGSRGGKRRSVVGADHVKHRRTRSGCFTCRQRRVKVRYGRSNLGFSILTLMISSATRLILFVKVSKMVIFRCQYVNT
jgi:hypothetical protein